tara:strand:- start:303 stop:977 length:675 start_codon:yes stop_codon:yes gene_type:complete
VAKRLSEKQIEEIIKSFISGKTINYLSEKYECTNLTISRNLKKQLGEKLYKSLIKESKSPNKSSSKKENKKNNEVIHRQDKEVSFSNNQDYTKDTNHDNTNESSTFVEITPLNLQIDNHPQQDLSSIPLSEINLPKIVYMLVDKKIELVIKLLKDYPEWQFLSNKELNRKTIKIYLDIKNAKKECQKEQRVIKVPNTGVFKIVAPILVSRGISRIVSSNQLIAL